MELYVLQSHNEEKNTKNHEGANLTATFPFKCEFVPQQYTLDIASGNPAPSLSEINKGQEQTSQNAPEKLKSQDKNWPQNFEIKKLH